MSSHPNVLLRITAVIKASTCFVHPQSVVGMTQAALWSKVPCHHYFCWFVPDTMPIALPQHNAQIPSAVPTLPCACRMRCDALWPAWLLLATKHCLTCLRAADVLGSDSGKHIKASDIFLEWISSQQQSACHIILELWRHEEAGRGISSPYALATKKSSAVLSPR